MSTRNAQNGRPRIYAQEKRGMLLGRQRDDRIMGPLTRSRDVMFPGLPLAALLGFTAFSMSATENTTESSATQSFHEIGLYQCEAGPRTGPAPNPNPAARDNTYGRLARSASVKQALGQPSNGPGATMVPDAWKRPEHWSDQIAVGLAGILSHVSTLNLDARIQPRDSSSCWYWYVAMMAFSRGNGQARSVLNAYAGELAGVPEGTRWRAFRAAVARDIVGGTGPTIGRRPGTNGAAYAIVRCDQKAESGSLIASSGERAWFSNALRDDATDNAIEQAIAQCAYSTAITVTAIADVATDVAGKATDIALIASDLAVANPLLTVAGTLLVLTGVVLWYIHRDDWYY